MYTWLVTGHWSHHHQGTKVAYCDTTVASTNQSCVPFTRYAMPLDPWAHAQGPNIWMPEFLPVTDGHDLSLVVRDEQPQHVLDPSWVNKATPSAAERLLACASTCATTLGSVRVTQREREPKGWNQTCARVYSCILRKLLGSSAVSGWLGGHVSHPFHPQIPQE